MGWVVGFKKKHKQSSEIPSFSKIIRKLYEAYRSLYAYCIKWLSKPYNEYHLMLIAKGSDNPFLTIKITCYE